MNVHLLSKVALTFTVEFTTLNDFARIAHVRVNIIKLIDLRIPALSEQLTTTKGTLSGVCEVTYRLHSNTTSTREVMFGMYILFSRLVQNKRAVVAVLSTNFIDHSIIDVSVCYSLSER